MITKEDIQHLANLARIDVSDTELDQVVKDVDSILGYVGQITSTPGDMEREVPPLHNIMREDTVTRTPGEYTEALLSNVPDRQGKYLKVKKILGGGDNA